MMRVVIDTNVFVSSFFGGKPRKVIDSWTEGKVTWCLSRPIVDEYVDVLARLGLQEPAELSELLKVFATGNNILFAAATPCVNMVEQDPDDNKFIECAVALGCPWVISGDKHLTRIDEYMGIKIVTPFQFLERLSSCGPL